MFKVNDKVIFFGLGSPITCVVFDVINKVGETYYMILPTDFLANPLTVTEDQITYAN